MNFDRHDPIHDPGAEDEARTFKESSSDGTHSADGYEQHPEQNGGYYDEQNSNRGPRNQQPTPAQQFDPYYDTGLDYDNQLPDQMYGDSQQQEDAHQYDEGHFYSNEDQYNDTTEQDHGESWEGSQEGSYDQSSATGSSAYSQSDGGSYDQDSRSRMQSNNGGGSFEDAESSHQSQQSGGGSFASVESSQQSQYSEHQQPSPGIHSNYNDSGEDFEGSGQSFEDQGEYDQEYDDYDGDEYEEDNETNEEDNETEEGSYGEYSDDGEEKGLLPPVT
jgi:hypothetical protein